MLAMNAMCSQARARLRIASETTRKFNYFASVRKKAAAAETPAVRERGCKRVLVGLVDFKTQPSNLGENT